MKFQIKNVNYSQDIRIGLKCYKGTKFYQDAKYVAKDKEINRRENGTCHDVQKVKVKDIKDDDEFEMQIIDQSDDNVVNKICV